MKIYAPVNWHKHTHTQRVVCLWPLAGVFFLQMCLMFSVAFCCISTRASLYALCTVLHSTSKAGTVGSAVFLSMDWCRTVWSGSLVEITVGELRRQPLTATCCTSVCRTGCLESCLPMNKTIYFKNTLHKPTCAYICTKCFVLSKSKIFEKLTCWSKNSLFTH